MIGFHEHPLMLLDLKAMQTIDDFEMANPAHKLNAPTHAQLLKNLIMVHL